MLKKLLLLQIRMLGKMSMLHLRTEMMFSAIDSCADGYVCMLYPFASFVEFVLARSSDGIVRELSHDPDQSL